MKNLIMLLILLIFSVSSCGKKAEEQSQISTTPDFATCEGIINFIENAPICNVTYPTPELCGEYTHKDEFEVGLLDYLYYYAYNSFPGRELQWYAYEKSDCFDYFIAVVNGIVVSIYDYNAEEYL